MSVTVGVVVITQSQSFFETGLSVLNDIKEHVLNQVNVDADLELILRATGNDPVYLEARNKAIRYLSNRKETIDVQVIQAGSIDRALEKISRASDKHELMNFQVGMVYYDQSSMAQGEQQIVEIDDDLARFYDGLKLSGVPSFNSPFSVGVFIANKEPAIRYQSQEFIECIMPDSIDVLQTGLLCMWMDFFENSYANRRIKPDPDFTAKNCLGDQLIRFLARESGNDWLSFYYTGSVVSSLINFFEQHSAEHGGLVLRGPNEHALACGAMASWQLYQKPFSIVVTSGMAEEFKGTLVNLREARAKGFIIVAESRDNQWFPFQGTITPDEDTREVLAAKRVPYVYFDTVENIETCMKEAFEKYHADEGPVFLLVTPKVLEYTAELDTPLWQTVTADTVQQQVAAFPADETESLVMDQQTRESMDRVMALLNEGPDKVLWQLGALTERETELVIDIAERAGIALTDSLSHPGAISKYRHGERNPNYLGTFSIYGYSPRVYSYLYTNHKINSKAQQALFFIKSKINELATPFTEGRLKQKIDITQVTHRSEHIAPFADQPVHMNSLAFLHYVSDNLNVPDDLLHRRQKLMNSYQDTPSDVVSKLPILPMSPNYFFNQFNKLVERLIVQDGFDYTGVYDVGRCGISAIRNVATTRRGFSGWYGRALMGDALLATVTLAHTSPGNVIAFIGDGARGVVPDILPSFIENVLSHPESLNKNITVLYFCNGGHSVINTYQERIMFRRTSRQMRLVNLHQDDWEDTICGFKVVAKTIREFDEQQLADAITEPRRLNLFSVQVSHNNEGDGITLATADGWQRDPVQPLEPQE